MEIYSLVSEPGYSEFCGQWVFLFFIFINIVIFKVLEKHEFSMNENSSLPLATEKNLSSSLPNVLKCKSCIVLDWYMNRIFIITMAVIVLYSPCFKWSLYYTILSFKNLFNFFSHMLLFTMQCIINSFYYSFKSFLCYISFFFYIFFYWISFYNNVS